MFPTCEKYLEKTPTRLRSYIVRSMPVRRDSVATLRHYATRLATATRPREALLVGAVLAPALLQPARRRAFARLDPPYRAALTLMASSALAGHFALDSRVFPFVNWYMYTAPVSGDPVVFEYDGLRRSGETIPLVFSRYLGTQSAGRLMEALRRQVCRLQALPDDAAEKLAARREHELALRAIAGRHNRRHPEDPVATVLVSERTISISSGNKSPSRRLWNVDVP